MHLEIGIHLTRNIHWLPRYDDCSRVYNVSWLIFDVTWWMGE